MRLAAICVLLAILSTTVTAQDPLHGNGVPSAYVENTPGILGGNLTVGFGSPGTPNGLAVVCVSGSFTLFTYPFAELGGPLALNPLDPAYQLFFFGLDAQGHGSVTVPLPPTFLPATAPPLYTHTLTFDSPTQWSVSKTARIDWMVPNGWEAVQPLSTVRQMHTATALGSGPRDNLTEVLICGGATGSVIVPTPMAFAELFSPLTRAVSPLPGMSLPRAGHRAELLRDGRVLITGGITTGGRVTATCEFFDPATRTFVPAPSMGAPRAGHAMTVLGNGRVLVSGGVADWQNTATAFHVALGTAQASAEVFDPVANVWTPTLLPMSSRRMGHAQVLLPDGRVLIVSGIYGGQQIVWSGQTGQFPNYTDTCEIFNPPASLFNPTASLPSPPLSGLGGGRAFFGASLLPDGTVLVTGGTWPGGGGGSSAPTNECLQWSQGSWTRVAPLITATAFHTQATNGSGALVVGGFVGDLATLQPTPGVMQHNVTSVVGVASIGTAAGFGQLRPRGAHSMTRLCDGTFLVYGGGVWPSTLGDGWIYAPN